MHRRRGFYGYWIAGAVFVLAMAVNGSGQYAFSLFVKPLEADMAWSRAGVMSALLLYNLTIAVTSPVVGRAVDRYGARAVMGAGACVMGVALVAAGLSRELWQYAAAWGLLGAGVSGLGFIPASALLFRWFRRRRGLATGIMGVGIGAGGFVIAPITGGVLIPQVGWRMAFFALAGGLLALAVPLVLLVLRESPESIGQRPDGLEEAEEGGAAHSGNPAGELGRVPGLTLKEAARVPRFWVLAASLICFGFAMNAVFQNHVPHLQDIGFPVAAAASALSVVGIGSAFGKFVFAWACDWAAPRYVFVAGVLLQCIAVLILMAVRPGSSLAMVWLYAGLYGIGIGCWPIMGMVVESTFGIAHYGTIFGVLNMIYMLGSSVGAPFAGYVYDVTGGYRTAFAVFVSALVVAIPGVLVAGRPAGERALPAVASGAHARRRSRNRNITSKGRGIGG